MNLAQPVRNIDVALLRTFVATAESGSMTLAARMLNRTQGAVSQQISRLEALFGIALFERRSNRLQLTPEGESLCVGAHRMIAENDALLARMQGDDIVAEVTLGVPPDIVGALVPPALRVFRRRHPNVRIKLVSQGTRSLRELIERNSIDLALTTDAVPMEGEGPILSDELVWVGAKNGKAHVLRPMPVALGEETCAFRAAAVNSLVRARIDWRPIVQVGSLEPVIASLSADMAVAVFLSRTVPNGLVSIDDNALPKLPAAYVNLIFPSRGANSVAQELATLLRIAVGAEGSILAG